jgi:hypothetical protein
VHCSGPTGRLVGLIHKLDRGGQVVPTYRESGLRTGLFGSDLGNAVQTLRVGGTGHLYAGGWRENPTPPDFWSDFAVARLDAAGDAVTDFGNNGVVVLDNARDSVSDLHIDGRGRLYVGGPSTASRDRPESMVWSFILYRLGS